MHPHLEREHVLPRRQDCDVHRGKLRAKARARLVCARPRWPEQLADIANGKTLDLAGRSSLPISQMGKL
eukprot:538490-Pleurochrysis_carterae.AAC.1